ncbi:hypothetical protein D915_003105 [Fasciola hepatica]|uniref:Transmembrane protein n=1 Tax=Fasciola hepatica TaxID=6192 RepID=A0A4E0REP8_FASHE|nr:hypothetical protein D915_003105 [Fasciola hepatica]
MQTLNRLFSSVPGAVEIYRAGDRLKFYRFFGLFCFGHTVTWVGLTYYQGWYKVTERERLQMQFKEMIDSARRLLGLTTNISADDSKVNSVSEPVERADGMKENSFFATQLVRLQKFSDETKKYDKTLIPVFTSLFAILTFAMGVFLPRRIVRRLTLIPGPQTSSYGHSTPCASHRLVEIETYGAFAVRSNPVRFQVPLDKVYSPNTSSNNFQFFVKNIPFRFIMEQEGAEFSNPHEFDFTFSVRKKT